MKKLIGILILNLLTLTHLDAQQVDTTLSLENFEMPISPGFILLDEAPSIIERPANPKAFAISVLNSLATSKGIPENYAVELSPFWYFKHKNLNALKFVGYNNYKQRPFSSIKFATLSVAFIHKADSTIQNSTNNVSFGVRTNLLKIKSKKQLEKIGKANRGCIEHLKNIDKEISKRIEFDMQDPSGYLKKYSELLVKYQDSLKDDFAKTINEKPLLAVDVAFAYNLKFTENDFSSNRYGRMGAWITICYSNKIAKESSSYLNVYAFARYIQEGGVSINALPQKNRNNVDIGGKIEFEFRKLSFGYEYIGRFVNTTFTHRSSGQLKYKISNTLYFTGALGKNFNNTQNLITFAGINWGFASGNEKATMTSE